MEPPLKLMASSYQNKKNTSESFDRFSDLPEPIIHHIFSFLGMNDIPRISTLSRRFRQLCISSPYLYFELDFHLADCGGKCTRFRNFLDRLLSLRNGMKICCFRLHWICYKCKFPDKKSLLKKWIRDAGRSNVEELDIMVRKKLLDMRFLRCKLLRVLKLNLQGGNFKLPPLVYDSLVVLSLSKVKIVGKSFGELLSTSSKSLKRLILEEILLVGSLNITSSYLEDLTILHCSEFTESFGVSGSSLKNLTIAWSQFRGCLVSISCLSLENSTISGCYFWQNCNLSITSDSLKDLAISMCRFEYESHINVSAERLLTLSMEMYFKTPRIGSFKIFAPNFQSFNWIGTAVEYSCLDSFASLRCATIHVTNCHLNDGFIEKFLHELFSSVKCAQALEVSLSNLKVSLLQHDMALLFQNLQHLVLIADREYGNPKFTSFLMGLLNLRSLTIKKSDRKSAVFNDIVRSLSLGHKSFFTKNGELEKLVLTLQLKKVEIQLKGMEKLALLKYLLRNVDGMQKMTFLYSRQ